MGRLTRNSNTILVADSGDDEVIVLSRGWEKGGIKGRGERQGDGLRAQETVQNETGIMTMNLLPWR